HAVYPSYMMDKSQHPYEGESFIDSDGECIGQGMMVRISNIVANKNAVVNLVTRSIKQLLFQPMVYDKRLGISQDDMKKLQQEGGIVGYDQQGIDIRESLAV